MVDTATSSDGGWAVASADLEPAVGRFGPPIAAKPDFVVVISPERTGTTAISHTLKAALGDERVVQVHYLNADRYRGPTENPEKLDSIADKRAREARAREWLADPSLRGVAFSIVRQPASRIASALWMHKTDELLRHYDPGRRTFRPEVDGVFARRLQEAMMKQANYSRDVYVPLGLAPMPAVGVHRTRNGARMYVLAFDNLARDFSAATEAAFGYPIALAPAKNGADSYAAPEPYEAFRRYCAELLKSETFRISA